MKTKSQKKTGMSKMGKHSKIFYWSMFSLPLLQFLIFYIGVNFNSILMAFQNIYIERDYANGGVKYITEFAGLETFKKFITVELAGATGKFASAIPNSLIYLVFSVVVVIPLGLLFSYYVYKKYKFSETFRTFLFLPSVICSLILVIFYSGIVDQAYPAIMQAITGVRPQGLLANDKTAFYAVAFFSFFFAFGPSVLIYVNAMSQVSKEVIESAELDGATGIKQFIHIILPLIWPSIVSYIVISFAQVAVNQLNAFSFYGTGAGNMKADSIGYVLFNYVADTSQSSQAYSIASAGGILFTLIVAPVTLTIKWALEKYGPSED